MQADVTTETVSRLLEIVVMALVAYLGLRIKSAVDDVRLEQKDVKASLLHEQVLLREDFNAKHAENSKTIAVHETSDKVMFDGISRTLNRIDGKLDKMNGHQK